MRVDGLQRAQEMMKVILETLDMISDNHDGSYSKDARNDAQGVYWTFKQFPLAIHLVIVRHIISYTHSLTYECQQRHSTLQHLTFLF